MKAKALKEFLNSLTEEQLNQELVYNSNDLCISGKVKEVAIQKEDLFYTGEDDPAELYTKSQLEDEGYFHDDIMEFDIEIPAGSIVVEF